MWTAVPPLFPSDSRSLLDIEAFVTGILEKGAANSRVETLQEFSLIASWHGGVAITRI